MSSRFWRRPRVLAATLNLLGLPLNPLNAFEVFGSALNILSATCLKLLAAVRSHSGRVLQCCDCLGFQNDCSAFTWVEEAATSSATGQCPGCVVSVCVRMCRSDGVWCSLCYCRRTCRRPYRDCLGAPSRLVIDPSRRSRAVLTVPCRPSPPRPCHAVLPRPVQCRPVKGCLGPSPAASFCSCCLSSCCSPPLLWSPDLSK